MKKLVCLMTALLLITACNDTADVLHYPDLMGFAKTSDLENAAGNADNNYGSYFSSATSVNMLAGEQLRLTVSRDAYVAERKYPAQKATIKIESSSTAQKGIDFDISTTSLRFKKGVYSLPVLVTTNPSAASKTIVLRLEYGYTDVSPKEERKFDTLTIHVD
ncbi:MAG: hypothetical protein ACI35M_06710 [Alistipes sp.]